MNNSVLERIRILLNEAEVNYRELTHEATHTSEESARVRGEDLSTGAKALLLKCDELFSLFVLPANRKLNSQSIRKQLGHKSSRFATAAELLELTGLVPGSLPPFGEPILPFHLYADVETGQEQNRVAFNAGSLTTSIIMSAEDWRGVARPQSFSFSSM